MGHTYISCNMRRDENDRQYRLLEENNHRMSKKELDTLLKTFEQKLEQMSVTNVNNQEEEMGSVRYFENREF